MASAQIILSHELHRQKKSATDITADSNFLPVAKVPQKGNQGKSVNSVTIQRLYKFHTAFFHK
jgi:hypothetical protein